MQPPEAGTATSPTQINLALAGLADELVGTLARLFVYVGTLALFAMLGLAALGELADEHADEPADRPGWSVATRAQPAFALSRVDTIDKTVSYSILRHPDGGRKDVMRWVDGDGKPLAELEIYREGEEFDEARPAAADLAARMGLTAATPLEHAGLIETKFGPIALLRPTSAADGTGTCLGYLQRTEEPPLQISGYVCQRDTLPARRAAVACMLNRLTLLASGREPKLADLFARAELKRRGCEAPASSDWLLGTADAQLRGAL